MNRNPIDIVIKQGIYYIEMNEGETPWSTEEPWLIMAVATAITGAKWIGPENLDGDELQEIMNWCDETNLLPRARGRVVQVQRRNKHTEFAVDSVVTCTVSDFDIRGNPTWWHKAIRSIMANSFLDYPLDIIEVDKDTGQRSRIPAY